jgi:CRISPR-associated endonuclease/helicase Cas3
MEGAWAHVAKDGRFHLLSDHLQDVATLAARFGAFFGSSNAARLAGLWHDVGKFSGDFQRMIREENGIEAHIEREGGPRDHSTAGALLARERMKQGGDLLAFAIAGHHTGLDDQHSLKQRLQNRLDQLEHVKRRAPPSEIMNAEVDGWCPEHFTISVDPLDLELWIRLLFSALCDADFLDTETFFRPAASADRNRPTDLNPLREQLARILDQKSRSDTEVNRVRTDVHRACLEAATRRPGVFSLTVPTGGGKTLASMAFALKHAILHGLRRVVVAIPFTSILEQTAKVYRDIFGDDSVVEHHSALDPDHEDPRNRIASENWDAPIIVTTTVQLFESLLANRPSKCRKLHNLTKSVIIFDEAQSLPGQLLPVILDVLGRLCAHYQTTLVISTATQPSLGKSQTIPEGFSSVTEICPPSLHLFERLRRVRVHWPSNLDPISYERLAEELAEESRVLCVVHRRKDAAELCRLADARIGDETTFHLSALMTPVHRRETLYRLRTALERVGPVRLISTQLVEAGVDVDFPVVYRAFGGLDALAQAAGRCNREGRLARLGELRVFFAPTEPPRGIAQTARDIARTMWTIDPDLDLFAPETHTRFFDRLYHSTNLSVGRDLQKKRRDFLFRTVGEGTATEKGFEMITSDWAAPLVIVHTVRAAELVAELEANGPSRRLLRSLQSFIVNVKRQDLDRWLRNRSVRLVAETVTVLDRTAAAGAYDVRFGLMPERVGLLDPAHLVQ